MNSRLCNDMISAMREYMLNSRLHDDMSPRMRENVMNTRPCNDMSPPMRENVMNSQVCNDMFLPVREYMITGIQRVYYRRKIKNKWYDSSDYIKILPTHLSEILAAQKFGRQEFMDFK